MEDILDLQVMQVDEDDETSYEGELFSLFSIGC